MERIYILMSDHESIDVMLKDGGMASIYHNGERFLTNYYQSRFTSEELAHYEKWDIAQQESKMYIKDWDEDIMFINQTMIHDAVKWLDVGIDVNYTEMVFLQDRHDMADLLRIEENKTFDADFEEKFNIAYMKIEDEIEEIRKEYAENCSYEEDMDLFRRIGEKSAQLRMMDKEMAGWKMSK